MKKILILLITLTCFGITGKAQDYHLSQYDMSPLYLNPALTGRYLGDQMDFRITGNYRTQWQKLQGKPYSTVATAFDMPYKKWGFGAYLIDNIAGTGNYSTLNFVTSGAYQITQDAENTHHLTAGLQLGIMQKSMNKNDLLFESQYTNSNGLDPEITSGELFSKQNLLRFDANVGIFYKYRNSNKKANPYAGFSVYHITMPDESFTAQKSRTPMRFNVNIGCNLHVNAQVLLIPTVLYMNQRQAQEINMGLKSYYTFKDSPYNMLLGLNYRWQDAFVLQLGVKEGNNEFRLSYDIVTSYLKNYSGSRGGFEMGVIYTGMGK